MMLLMMVILTHMIVITADGAADDAYDATADGAADDADDHKI